MIETFSGNHMAQQAEREHNYEPKCPCGSKVWEAVEVCEFEHSIECTNDNCEDGDDVCTPVPAFKCVECGYLEGCK